MISKEADGTLSKMQFNEIYLLGVGYVVGQVPSSHLLLLF